MAYLELPTRSDVPAFQYQIELEQVLYGFSFAWNDRSGFWTMTITDAVGEPLINGVKLQTGWLLVDLLKLEGFPPGSLFCLDSSGQNLNPGRDNFGSTVILMYRESTTVDE
jgi:hypothetical protein